MQGHSTSLQEKRDQEGHITRKSESKKKVTTKHNHHRFFPSPSSLSFLSPHHKHRKREAEREEYESEETDKEKGEEVIDQRHRHHLSRISPRHHKHHHQPQRPGTQQLPRRHSADDYSASSLGYKEEQEEDEDEEEFLPEIYSNTGSSSAGSSPLLSSSHLQGASFGGAAEGGVMTRAKRERSHKPSSKHRKDETKARAKEKEKQDMVSLKDKREEEEEEDEEQEQGKRDKTEKEREEKATEKEQIEEEDRDEAKWKRYSKMTKAEKLEQQQAFKRNKKEKLKKRLQMKEMEIRNLMRAPKVLLDNQFEFECARIVDANNNEEDATNTSGKHKKHHHQRHHDKIVGKTRFILSKRFLYRLQGAEFVPWIALDQIRKLSLFSSSADEVAPTESSPREVISTEDVTTTNKGTKASTNGANNKGGSLPLLGGLSVWKSSKKASACGFVLEAPLMRLDLVEEREEWAKKRKQLKMAKKSKGKGKEDGRVEAASDDDDDDENEGEDEVEEQLKKASAEDNDTSVVRSFKFWHEDNSVCKEWVKSINDALSSDSSSSSSSASTSNAARPHFLFGHLNEHIFSSRHSFSLYAVPTPNESAKEKAKRLARQAKQFMEAKHKAGKAEARLAILELITEKGFPAEEHKVQTKDGYILTTHRIPHGRSADLAEGEDDVESEDLLSSVSSPVSSSRSDSGSNAKKPVVLLWHGLLDCSVTWFLNTEIKSLAFILTNNGFDVWMGNSRGNRFSREHITYRDTQDEFWDFNRDSLVEDVKATIDYVLEHTGASTLGYVGHSQGTHIMFALLASDPAYHFKINLFTALAPAVYVSNQKSKMMTTLAAIKTDKIFQLFGIQSFMTSLGFANAFAPNLILNNPSVSKAVTQKAFGALCGWNPEENFCMDRMPILAAHQPGGTSVQVMAHWSQAIQLGGFVKYNYGKKKNAKVYGQPTPLSYDLSGCCGGVMLKKDDGEEVVSPEVPIALFYGGKDKLTTVVDVERLISDLPRRPCFLHFEPGYAHLDFVWGEDADEKIFPHVLSLVDKYCGNIRGSNDVDVDLEGDEDKKEEEGEDGTEEESEEEKEKEKEE